LSRPDALKITHLTQRGFVRGQFAGGKHAPVDNAPRPGQGQFRSYPQPA
jgi:hypothetical protein